MPKAPPSPDFKIHVDPSCLTDSTDLKMPVGLFLSNQTDSPHDSEDTNIDNRSGEETNMDATVAKGDNTNTESKVDGNEQETCDRQIDRIEAQIQAAARAVVASIKEDEYRGNESVLSTRTDESYATENSQLPYEEGSILSTQSYEEYDQENSQLSYYQENSQLSYEGTEGAEEAYETEDEHLEQEAEADSSSHHDGDIDDDVFSHSAHSGRSSLNSLHDTSDEANRGKELTSPVVGEEAAEPISRIPSAASYTPRGAPPYTPSKVISRPTFRNPSSVRAMQMSSPTPSIFSSARSAKRHLPTVSRIGTPSSHSSFSPTKKTPTRFKAKKEPPLVLLHVTVLPLAWTYSHTISSPDLPPSLQRMRENWRLLHEKLGDTVLERGILLPHPQDSYEVLEERLLEALELPVRPRVRILKCGHYMGPETPTSDEEGRPEFLRAEDRMWCDICGREVKIEGSGMEEKREHRFRVKIYASNGLMRAGAWAAAWREMERVDVELEPFIEGHLASELDSFTSSMSHSQVTAQEPEDDGFVDEDESAELIHEHIDQHIDEQPLSPEEEELMAREEESLRRQRLDEERLREIYGDGHPRAESTHQPETQPTPRPVQHGDSLAELLVAAFKVAMRDRRNILICLLSVLVVLLALKPGAGSVIQMDPVVRDSRLHMDSIIPDLGMNDVVEIVRGPAMAARPLGFGVSKEVQPDLLEAAAVAGPHVETALDALTIEPERANEPEIGVSSVLETTPEVILEVEDDPLDREKAVQPPNPEPPAQEASPKMNPCLDLPVDQDVTSDPSSMHQESLPMEVPPGAIEGTE